MRIDIAYEIFDADKIAIATARTPEAVAYFTSLVDPWVWEEGELVFPGDWKREIQIFPKRKLKKKWREWREHGLRALPYDKIEAGDDDDENP